MLMFGDGKVGTTLISNYGRTGMHTDIEMWHFILSDKDKDACFLTDLVLLKICNCMRSYPRHQTMHANRQTRTRVFYLTPWKANTFPFFLFFRVRKNKDL